MSFWVTCCGLSTLILDEKYTQKKFDGSGIGDVLSDCLLRYLEFFPGQGVVLEREGSVTISRDGGGPRGR